MMQLCHAQTIAQQMGQEKQQEALIGREVDLVKQKTPISPINIANSQNERHANSLNDNINTLERKHRCPDDVYLNMHTWI